MAVRTLLQSIALVASASASAGTPPTLPLNDTGIETCYGASAPQSCAITSDYSRQDARFGRDPAYADAMFNLALLLQRVGNHAEAVAWWRQYLTLDQASPWASRAKRALKYCEMQMARP